MLQSSFQGNKSQNHIFHHMTKPTNTQNQTERKQTKKKQTQNSHTHTPNQNTTYKRKKTHP